MMRIVGDNFNFEQADRRAGIFNVENQREHHKSSERLYTELISPSLVVGGFSCWCTQKEHLRHAEEHRVSGLRKVYHIWCFRRNPPRGSDTCIHYCVCVST